MRAETPVNRRLTATQIPFCPRPDSRAGVPLIFWPPGRAVEA